MSKKVRAMAAVFSLMMVMSAGGVMSVNAAETDVPGNVMSAEETAAAVSDAGYKSDADFSSEISAYTIGIDSGDKSSELISPAPEDIAVISPALEDEDGFIRISDAKSYIKNKCTMVPLRKTAEALGYTVTWNQTEKCANLQNSDYSLNVYIGEDSYVRTSPREIASATAPMSYGCAPEIVDNLTCVPAKVFEILDYSVHVEGSTIMATGINYLNNNSGTTNPESVNHTGSNGSESASGAADENAQIPSPMADYDTVAAAEKAAGFKINIPLALKALTPESVQTISAGEDGCIAQIEYSNGVCFRTGKTAGCGSDISGDYNVYAYKSSVETRGKSVSVKGDTENSLKIATWTESDMVYSLSFEEGVTLNKLKAVIG